MAIQWFGSNLSDSVGLWRYMDCLKLIDILLNKRLFFSRVENFEDPSEITYFPEHLLKTEQGKDNANEFLKELKKRLCVNCWHINETESMGMWKAYRCDSSVAIISSIENINKVVQEVFTAAGGLCLGRVSYINDTSQIVTGDDGKINPHHLAFYKNEPWEYERELRLVYELYCNEDNLYGLYEKASKFGLFCGGRIEVVDGGFFVNGIEPKNIIQKIVISPYARNSAATMMSIIKKIDDGIEVETSKLL